uniref:Protein TonB n=1 Tax=Candidatus Kentrum sp. DK TaxID=2126562 RepID=A0A450T7R5_9GAMM|nr:MAG: outer membrane transport energization protein TonB [Candidatus Kentron sp. DK]
MPSRREVIGFSLSAALHGALLAPYLVGSPAPAPTSETITPLTLAMFEPPRLPAEAPVPEAPKPAPKPQTEPRPKPEPKPKPKPAPKTEPQPSDESESVHETTRPAPAGQPSPPVRSAPEKPAAPALHDPGLVQRIADRYRAKLRALIEANKRYPRRARRTGQQGKAIVAFTVLRDGRIEEIRLVEPAGHKILDRAVIDAIAAVSGALPIPKEIGTPSWPFRISLEFVLHGP